MSTHPVSNFPEAEFRFSRADRRCSCSSSTRRYSCSHRRHPRSRSHCCSSDPTHGRWDSLPFTHYVLLRRFALYVKTGSRDGFAAASALRFSEYIFFVLEFSEEAEPTADARARVRRGVMRERIGDTRVRVRIAARATQHTASSTIG